MWPGSCSTNVTMKLFPSVILLTGLVLGSVAYGQDPAPSPQKSSAAQKISVTGCLMKGTEPSQYMITDQKTGEKVAVSGPSQLDKYLNQTVKLSGTLAAQGQDKVLKAESLNPVAATCEKGQ
jgi:multidrug efflux pump subunit AcrA (membrane-fusion protein)